MTSIEMQQQMVDSWLKMDNYIPAEEDIERLKKEGFIRKHKVPLERKEEEWQFTLEVASNDYTVVDNRCVESDRNHFFEDLRKLYNNEDDSFMGKKSLSVRLCEKLGSNDEMGENGIGGLTIQSIPGHPGNRLIVVLDAEVDEMKANNCLGSDKGKVEVMQLLLTVARLWHKALRFGKHDSSEDIHLYMPRKNVNEQDEKMMKDSLGMMKWEEPDLISSVIVRDGIETKKDENVWTIWIYSGECEVL